MTWDYEGDLHFARAVICTALIHAGSGNLEATIAKLREGLAELDRNFDIRMQALLEGIESRLNDYEMEILHGTQKAKTS